MSRNNSNTATVIMLETRKGSEDGIQVKSYIEGEVYELPTSLSSVFLKEKWAKIYRPDEENSDEEEEEVDKGGATPMCYLPEGMLTREKLAEDNLSNKELIRYAEEFLDVEEGSIKFNMKHGDLLKKVISLQEEIEKELSLED